MPDEAAFAGTRLLAIPSSIRAPGNQQLPRELAMHGLVHHAVSRTHHLGKAEEADGSYQQSSQCGLEEVRPARQRAQAWPQIAERFGKYQRRNAAGDSEHGIGAQLARISQRDLRNAKDRFGAPEPGP